LQSAIEPASPATSRLKHHSSGVNDRAKRFRKGEIDWLFFEKGSFFENLYEVPFQSLIMAGAYGHGLIKELLFGSRMEEIHSILPNNMLIVGPYTTV
jgi:hypothetical protein